MTTNLEKVRETVAANPGITMGKIHELLPDVPQGSVSGLLSKNVGKVFVREREDGHWAYRIRDQRRANGGAPAVAVYIAVGRKPEAVTIDEARALWQELSMIFSPTTLQ